MSCPIHASTITATGSAYAGRARLKGMYFVGNGTAGSIAVTNGDGGNARITVAVPAVADAYDLLIPDDGILCEDGIYATLTNVTSVTFLYE